MPQPLTTAIFACVGILCIALSRPLIRRVVPPNRLSGLRVRATFADPEVWYDANAAFGRDLGRFGGAVLVAAFILPWVAGPHATLILTAGVVLGAVVLAIVGTARANRLLDARRGSAASPTAPP